MNEYCPLSTLHWQFLFIISDPLYVAAQDIRFSSHLPNSGCVYSIIVTVSRQCSFLNIVSVGFSSTVKCVPSITSMFRSRQFVYLKSSLIMLATVSFTLRCIMRWVKLSTWTYSDIILVIWIIRNQSGHLMYGITTKRIEWNGIISMLRIKY